MLSSDINDTKLENMLYGRFYHLISFVVSDGIVFTTHNVHLRHNASISHELCEQKYYLTLKLNENFTT